MISISRQIMMILPLFLVAGCATERYSIRGMAHRPAASKAAAVDDYSPQVEEVIPLPPSGAGYQQIAPEEYENVAPTLQKAERPPLLLRPVGWEVERSADVVLLLPPQPLH